MIKKVILLGIICFLLPTAGVRPAAACTLWAAAGERAAHGGTLIAKNRDWAPEQRQELRLQAPPGGFRFLKLHPQGSNSPHDIAGVNEKGLVLVTAAASCIPQAERPRSYFLEGFLERLLATCATVDEVVKRRGLLTSPAFYLAADRTKLALIEVAPDGKSSVQVTGGDALFHTNHYLDNNFQKYNKKTALSSQIRLIQIRRLLQSPRRPLGLEDFLRFSQDRRDGVDNSIWREGSSRRKVHTLATWIVSLPREGVPLLYVHLANPGEPSQARLLKLDAAFWAQGAGKK